MSTYIIAPKSNDLMHYGKGHDDNPPGRGSGRWAWGSGDNTSGHYSRRVNKYRKSSGTYTQKGVKKI
jgi:hypothetical protein